MPVGTLLMSALGPSRTPGARAVAAAFWGIAAANGAPSLPSPMSLMLAPIRPYIGAALAEFGALSSPAD